MKCPRCGYLAVFDFAKCRHCGWEEGMMETPFPPAAQPGVAAKEKNKDGCAACGGNAEVASHFYHPKIFERQYAELNMRVTETTYSPVQREVRLCANCISRRTLKFFGISTAIFFISLLIFLAAAGTGKFEGFAMVMGIAALWGMGGGVFLLGYECIFLSREERGDRLAGEFNKAEKFKTRRGFQKLKK